MKASGVKPRVHGNGFLQYDFDGVNRLHIWHPDLPKQKTPTPIHDHVFSFESRVIVGRLINVVYNFHGAPARTSSAEFRLHVSETRKDCDMILVPSDTYGYVTVANTQMVMASTYMGGNRYTMPKGWFHESIAPDGPTVTIITKFDKTQAQGGGAPRILVPVGVEPDNEFDRHHAMPESLLWSIIDETLAGRTRR